MKKIMAVLLSSMIILGMGGCSGVSQEEYDKVVSERDALQQELDALTPDKKDTEKKKPEGKNGSNEPANKKSIGN